MANVLIVAYLLIVLALIAVILLQRSEGGALGIGGGGGGGGLMTARGSANLLTRTTAILGALFFATAIGLTIVNELDRGSSGMLRALRLPTRQRRAMPICRCPRRLRKHRLLQRATNGRKARRSRGMATSPSSFCVELHARSANRC